MVQLGPGDALIVVDVQNDFLPGGRLAVPEGDAVIAPLNRYIELFAAGSLPVYATRDWHPADHSSFHTRGGIWPQHCIADTDGARFPAALHLPEDTATISKAVTSEKDAYSGFEETDLAERLHVRNIGRLFIGGLATDYCVLNTVRDALADGFKVMLLLDAIRAVELHAGDGQTAIEEMIERGAIPLRLADIETGKRSEASR